VSKPVVILLLALQTSLPCLAALGAHRDDLETERVRLKISSQNQVTSESTQRPYSVITMKTPSTTITQFANAQGKIFAVKWRGMTNPDLTVLLGDHLAEYQSIRENTPRAMGRRPFMKVQGSNFTVKHFGHMGDMQGLAYESLLVPAGVDPEALP
jgi:hypothetical protein